MILPHRTLLALLPFFLRAQAQASGSGTTTRYWDCCKASCGWPGKITLASGSNPVTSCDASDQPLTNYNAVSGCNSGSTYMCSTQQPWAVSEDLAYGFAATTISGGTEATWCCACYALTFTSGPVSGKKMIVQATNTGGDLSSNQFDLAVRPLSFPFPYFQHLPNTTTGTPITLRWPSGSHCRGGRPPPISVSSNHPTNTSTPDSRRRLRNLQRLHRRMGHPLHRLGRPIRRHLDTHPMRRLPRRPPTRLLLALRLVPERRQSQRDL
jgi:hypothetical protein